MIAVAGKLDQERGGHQRRGAYARIAVLAPLASGALLFLITRAYVWGQVASLDDIHLLLIGGVPVAAAALAYAADSDPAAGPPLAALWIWPASLALYMTAHLFRVFDAVEAPIRAAFDVDLLEYLAYGSVYVGVTVCGLIVGCLVVRRFRSGLTWAVAAAVSLGFFAVAVFGG